MVRIKKKNVMGKQVSNLNKILISPQSLYSEKINCFYKVRLRRTEKSHKYLISIKITQKPCLWSL